MNIPASLFPVYWHFVALLLSIGILLWSLWRVEWAKVIASGQIHQVLGSAVVLMLVWSMKAGAHPGLNLHLLGAMAVMLILGLPLAAIAFAIALTGISYNGAIEWEAWPVNYVFMVFFPLCIAMSLAHLVRRLLPAHIFVFIFATAFIGSGATVVFEGVITCTALILSGAYTARFLTTEYLPFFVLLGFAEAWISGAVVTLLIVFKPDWVSGFDDRVYLLKK